MEKYYLKYKNDVFRFVLSIVKDKYLAEDITQECFLKLFENQKNIRDFSKIKLGCLQRPEIFLLHH